MEDGEGRKSERNERKWEKERGVMWRGVGKERRAKQCVCVYECVCV